MEAGGSFPDGRHGSEHGQSPVPRKCAYSRVVLEVLGSGAGGEAAAQYVRGAAKAEQKWGAGLVGAPKGQTASVWPVRRLFRHQRLVRVTNDQDRFCRNRVRGTGSEEIHTDD